MAAHWQQPLPAMPAPPPARAWGRLRPPPGYEPQWRRLVDAALELGLGPDDLAEHGLEAITAARGWKPATAALYGKVARYGGLDVERLPTPEPDPLVLELRPLTEVRDDRLEHLRSVVWCAMAVSWPATVGTFRALRRDDVRVVGSRLQVSTDDGSWSVLGATRAWFAWEEARDRHPVLAASPWVLPALRRGPGLDSRVGGQLSTQALQVTFAKHAVRTAAHLLATAPPSRQGAVQELAADYRVLSYDSFRRLALAAGAAPVEARGSVRAVRSVGRLARLTG